MAVCMYPSVILGCCSACLVYQMHDEYNYIGQAEWLDKPHLFLHCTLCTAVVVWLCKNIISSKVCIIQITFTLGYAHVKQKKNTATSSYLIIVSIPFVKLKKENSSSVIRQLSKLLIKQLEACWKQKYTYTLERKYLSIFMNFTAHI